MESRPLVKRTDILIILAVLALAAGLLVCRMAKADNSGDIICVLYVDNKPLLEISLNKDGDIAVPGRPGVILNIKGRAIAFKQSNCPDKICVKTGYISQPGQTAVCLPNRTAIKIVSRKPDIDAPDMVAS